LLRKKGKRLADNTKHIRITRWDLFKVFLASFFMQAVWNFRSLISIGFAICFFPVIGKLCDSPEAKKEFFQRHLKFFNAHPYFASFALGIFIRLEELRAEGETHIPETIDRLRDLLISPLGAVGDRLFWATIKPASLILGMVGILIAPTIATRLIALAVCFLIYNIPHLYYRYEGIIEGYMHPYDIYNFISQQRFEVLRKVFVNILWISILLLIVFFGYHLLQLQHILVAFFVASAIYTVILMKISNNFYLVTLGSFIFFLVAAILFL
jgi:mannose/fructose/N-acetylgalactosamine-specific phosphotransferase system component IID